MTRRRRLRAVYAADVANFAGYVSADETRTLEDLWQVRRIANEALQANGGWLFGMPGDGIFALFESAVDAVRCALVTQHRLASAADVKLRLRIGIHLGEVLFKEDQPFGESLVVAARLESLAEPGGILVSSAVVDAVAPRIPATFEKCGLQHLKHLPRCVATFRVKSQSGYLELQATSDSQGTSQSKRSTRTLSKAERDLGRDLASTKSSRSSRTKYSLTEKRRSRDMNVVTKTEGNLTHNERKLSSEANRSESEPLGQQSVLEKTAHSKLRGKPMISDGAGQGVTQGTNLAKVKNATRISQSRTIDRSQGVNRAAIQRIRADENSLNPTIIAACLDDLTRALTKHIGPLARLIAKRKAATATSLGDLVNNLSHEIAQAQDREAFLTEAWSITAKSRQR
jgi:class 3 adenylate cyclase